MSHINAVCQAVGGALMSSDELELNNQSFIDASAEIRSETRGPVGSSDLVLAPADRRHQTNPCLLYWEKTSASTDLQCFCGPGLRNPGPSTHILIFWLNGWRFVFTQIQNVKNVECWGSEVGSWPAGCPAEEQTRQVVPESSRLQAEPLSLICVFRRRWAIWNALI